MQDSPEPINPATAPTDVLRDPEDLTTDEVRGGTTGHNVRYVLIISLAGAFIALAAAWVWVS